MASIFIFMFLSLFLTSAAQQKHFNISRDSSLTPTTNSSWLSPSGLYAFGFYQQANNGYAVGIFLAGIPQKTVVWTANRDNPPVSTNSTLQFTSNGRLVLQSQGQETSISDSSQTASYASMLDSGNFVLYGSNQDIIWQSFDHPTDTLLPGQKLFPGFQLVSNVTKTQYSTGIFRLKMQHDGNLVQYPVGTMDAPAYGYWQAETGGTGDNISFKFDDDGHLYLLNDTGFIVKNITKGGNPVEGIIYLLRIDADGLFRLYSHSLSERNGDWSIVWSSSNNKCTPKGLCGLNGYCVRNDQDAQCRCFPGFEFVTQGNWSAGCERNFTADSCKSKNVSMSFSIVELANTAWEDVPYEFLSLSTKEDCEKACLEDCNCEAAMLKDGNCTKQRPPFKFARRLDTESNIAFVKVGISTPLPDGVLIQPKEEKERDLRIDILIISVSLIVLSFIILAISSILFYRTRVNAYKKLSRNENNIGLNENVGPRSFTYAELEQVTEGFKEEVGQGAFGRVYKGILMSEGQKVVAVKRLDKVLAEGEQEFQTEMKVIGKTHHRNLVRLLGYCTEGPHRLLVYEYMSNGSLANVLFTPGQQPSLDERMEIARNVARGILYLHEECETQIIHCDIKPQNILMDEYRCAKISDFGLAKLLKPDQTRTFTGIRGTRGYVAPEWHRKLPVTVKADVYSFGIVLLEIICCRKNVDWSLPEEEAILEDWVYYCFEMGEIGKLVGEEEFDKRQLERMVKVGLWCVLDEPSLRPSMKKVLLMLEGTVDIPVPPSPTSFLSEI